MFSFHLKYYVKKNKSWKVEEKFDLVLFVKEYLTLVSLKTFKKS